LASTQTSFLLVALCEEEEGKQEREEEGKEEREE